MRSSTGDVFEPKNKRRLNYVPFKQTADAHLAFKDHRIVACVTGARGGKTTFGAAKVVDAALLQADLDYDDQDRGEPYTIAVGAPTFPMLRRVVLPAVLRMIPKELKIGQFHWGHHLQRVRGRRGETWLYFLSCREPSAWQGLKLYGAWLDEFPLVKETMYDEVQTRLSDRKGWLLLTGTPQGPNWAKDRIYDAHRLGADPSLAFFTWRTIDNPHIDAAYIERMRATMPPRYFRRTFEASWDIFEGQVYEAFLDSVHCYDPREYLFVLPTGRHVGPTTAKTKIILKNVVAGVDWGYGKGHAGAIVVCGKSRDNRCWYVLEDSCDESVVVTAPSGRDSWVARGQAAVARWGVEIFYCDTSGPESIQQFRRAGLNAVGANKAVREGIQHVAQFMEVEEGTIETHLRISRAAKGTLQEIPYYHWAPGMRREEPEKTMDHCMDAMRYAIYTADKRGVFDREVSYSKIRSA